jgi:molybdate/tungstate transport system ATP-binding protein
LALKIEKLSKQWPNFSLKNINLTVESGEYFALLGPTGAGKTILLETLMGFNKPDTGKIILDGKELTNLPPEKRNIGYVPQSALLFPHLTVYENVCFGLKIRKIKSVDQKEIAAKVLELTNLTKLSDRLPANLSGGEKQKVALARVLALDTQLILLDEPLISVDNVSARELREEIRQLNRTVGKTIIHVTHSTIEAINLASRMAIIQNGEILQVGKPKELVVHPKNVFVAQFLGYENVFTGELVEIKRNFAIVNVNGLKFRIVNKVNFRVSESLSFALLPENIILDCAQPIDPNVNSFSGFIENFEELGLIVIVTVNMGLMFKVALTKSTFIEKSIEIGMKVWLHFNYEDIKLLY